MGVYYNPKITRTNLVYYLDGKNAKCYSGSGISLNDLSSTGVASSFSCTFNSEGYFTEFGTNSVISANLDSSTKITAFNHGTSDYTHSFWAYFNSLGVDQQCLFTMTGAPFGQILYRVTNSTTMQINGPSSTPQLGLNTLVINKWYNLTFVRSSGNLTLYTNDVASSPASFSDTITATTSDSIRLGNPFFTGQNVDGRIACFSSYTRALSSSEVRQNFNALRGRFGV